MKNTITEVKNLLKESPETRSSKKRKKMINWKQLSQKIKKGEWEIKRDIITSGSPDGEERETREVI